MTMNIEQAAIDLATAGGLSSLIGFERQWRNRLAGLRTNTLVALGAASFVIFEALVPGEMSPSRVAAQVVSGIGFLGAGLCVSDLGPFGYTKDWRRIALLQPPVGTCRSPIRANRRQHAPSASASAV